MPSTSCRRAIHPLGSVKLGCVKFRPSKFRSGSSGAGNVNNLLESRCQNDD
ncbi:hypothetical protein QUB61_28730 [Microcoleus sp. C2D2]